MTIPQRFDVMRIPCTSLNEATTRAGTNTNCCPSCANATCHYFAHFKCYTYAPYGDYEREPVVWPCLLFKKDCVQGCTWSSRWANIGVSGNIADDVPLLADPLCDCNIDCMSADDRESSLQDCINNLIASSAHVGSCCHWGDPSDTLYQGFLGNVLAPICDMDDPTSNCYRKWILTISGTTATIVLASRGGYSATYTCNDFNCIGQSTFKLTSHSPEIYGLPTCICLTSVKVDRDDSSCFDEEDECPCCLDFDCGLPFYVSVCGGEPQAIAMEWVNTGQGSLLSCGILTTNTGICGHFLGFVDCEPLGNCVRLWFVAYCVGENTWQVDVYCEHKIDPEGACECINTTIDLLSSSVTGLSCECSGIHFSWQYELDEDCPCCEPLECCPCPGTPPATLTAEITTASGSCTLTLTHDVDCEYLTSGGPCIINGHEYSIEFNYNGGCNFGGSCDACAQDGVLSAVTSCDPLDIEATYDWSSCGGGCEDGVVRIYE